LFILRQTRRKGALWLGCNEWLQFIQIFARKTENPGLTSHSESSWQQCLDSCWYKERVDFQGAAVGQEMSIIPQPKIYSVFMFKPCGSRVTWVNYFKRYYALQNSRCKYFSKYHTHSVYLLYSHKPPAFLL